MYDMSARLNEPTEKRTALPLTARDMADLARLRVPGPERDALCALGPKIPATEELSESLLVHAVFVTGLRAVREQAEALSYAAEAADRQASAAESLRAARRIRPAWADED